MEAYPHKVSLYQCFQFIYRYLFCIIPFIQQCFLHPCLHALTVGIVMEFSDIAVIFCTTLHTLISVLYNALVYWLPLSLWTIAPYMSGNALYELCSVSAHRSALMLSAIDRLRLRHHNSQRWRIHKVFHPLQVFLLYLRYIFIMIHHHYVTWITFLTIIIFFVFLAIIYYIFIFLL